MASTTIISPSDSQSIGENAALPLLARHFIHSARTWRKPSKTSAPRAAEIAELIGHEQGFTFSVYAPMQLPMKALKELIERVRYPGLRLSHLYVG
jgi:hypothetical protein